MRHEPWRRPLRRMRLAIQASLRLIDSSQLVVDASEQFAGTRPVRTTRELQHAAGWLDDAAAHLGRAIRALSETTARAALAPERSGGLPGKLFDATARWVDAAGRLAAVSRSIDDRVASVVDAIANGTAVFPDPSLYRRPASAAPRIPMARRLLPRWPSCRHIPVITIHVRRRRSVPLAAAEPPRRISRGRAPPLSLVPSLIT